MKRTLLLILCALLCLTDVAGLAEEVPELRFPEKLIAIEQEAFMDDVSIQRVILHEGVQRIGARAFAFSSATDVFLPASLTDIAPDAFEGCDSIRLYVYQDSYAHAWCRQHDIPFTVLDASSTYGILSLAPVTAEDGTVFLQATVHTSGACTIRADVLQDGDESLLFSCTQELHGDLNAGQANIPLPQALPEFFVLRAVLLAENGDALCDVYMNRRYTSLYHDFENQSPADFPADKVLDYGSAGYAVLAEDVIPVHTALSQGNGRFLIATDAALSAGDVIYTADTQNMIKLASVSENGDGTLTIAEDPNISLGDMYDVINLDTCMVSGIMDKSDKENLDKTFPVVQDTFSIEVGPLEASATIDMTIRMKMIYDKHLFRDDYVDIEVYTETIGSVSVTLGASYDTWKEGTAPSIPVYSGIVMIPGVNLPATLIFDIPVNIAVEAGGSAVVNFHERSGFSYNPDDGKQDIDYKFSDAHVELKDSFTMAIGPEISLNFSLFKDAFSARIGAQVGLRAEGELVTPTYGGSTGKPEDSIHACQACIDADLFLFAELKGVAKVNIFDAITATLLDLNLPLADVPLGGAYISVINDVESIYGGALTFGLGECGNSKYRTVVHTQDYTGAEQTGLPVTITGEKTDPLSGSSPAAAYLYSGTYRASASFDSGIWDQPFDVDDRAVSITVREPQAEILGTVFTSTTNSWLEGATVTLTLDDGSTRTCVTDDQGSFEFDKLPGGTYVLSFEAGGHLPQTMDPQNFPAGTSTVLNVTLNADTLPVIVAETRGGAVQAKTENGYVPDNIPEIWITPSENRYGITGATITHEGCAEPLVYSTNIYPSLIKFFGVDMGNGEYTFALLLASSGTGGGYEVVLFRENNGALEALKHFTYSTFTDDVRVDARFSSDTDFSGVIYPTGRPFSGHVNKVWDFENRTGERFYDRTLGSITYKLNESGFYDLIFSTSEYCLGNWDTIGASNTRYVMRNGQLVIDQQWYEVYDGSVTNGD